MGVKELTKMRFQYEFFYFIFNNHKANLVHCSTETLLHVLLTNCTILVKFYKRHMD